MPPIIGLFATGPDILGIPLVVLYVFGTWFALIVGAAWLARRLAPDQAADDTD